MIAIISGPGTVPRPPSPKRQNHAMRSKPLSLAAAGLSLLLSCSDAPTGPEPTAPVDLGPNCSISTDLVFDGGVGVDGIPALTNPPMVGIFDQQTGFLWESDRVISFELGGQVFAVPHRILWWHEIVNLTLGQHRVAVTYCPLTGSSIVFDRSDVAGAEFGVSGLLFQNNLIMYDRTDGDRSLWPQMLREAGCGPRLGEPLPLIASTEVAWDRWRALNQNGLVVVRPDGGLSTQYDRYPYGDYESLENNTTFYPQTISDLRRPAKERVLGVLDGADGGKAYPFGELRGDGSPVTVVNDMVGGTPLLVVWDNAGEAAFALNPVVDGQTLTFEFTGGKIVDAETGSTWQTDGVAFEGPLEGTRLEPVEGAYIAFWFAWKAFQPGTELWEAG